MKHPTWFRSKRMRSSVVTALMVLCLLSALGIASFVTREHRIELSHHSFGQIAMDLPDWPQTQDSASIGKVHVMADLQEPQPPHRRLVVGRLIDTGPRRHTSALRPMAQLLNQIFSQKSFRVGRMVGLRYTGVGGTLKSPELHVMAALSEDASRYYLVWLRGPLDLARIQADERLNDTLCRRVVSQRWRPAGLHQLNQAGIDPSLASLPNDKPVSAFVPDENRTDQYPWPVITWMATEGSPELALMRVLLTTDVELGESGPLPAVADMLGDIFYETKTRRPRKDELSTVTLPHGSAYIMLLESSSLVRAIWYVPVGGGRAVLLETLADGTTSHQRTRAWVEALLDRIVQNGQAQAQASLQTDISAALERGETLIDRIRKEFADNYRPGLTYSVHEQLGHVLGWAIHQVGRRTSGSLSVHGNSVFVWPKDPARSGSRYERFLWRASTDVSAVYIQQRYAIRGDRGVLFSDSRRLQLQGGQLKLSRRNSRGPWQTLLKAEVPDAYLCPVAEDEWPVELLQDWIGTRALIWLSRGLRLPIPYWVQVQEKGDSTIVLHMRPLMSLDGDKWSLDASGRLIRLDLHDGPGSAATSVVIVDRETLIRQLPQLIEEIEQFEKELLSDE